MLERENRHAQHPARTAPIYHREGARIRCADGAVDSDSGSNPSDDGEVGVLEDTIANRAQQELTAVLDGLDDTEKIEVLALVWLGRGDFTAAEWPAALAQAREIHDARETAYLLGTPLLADYLAEGLAALGFSPEDYDPGFIA